MLDKWREHIFESSSGKTPEFLRFANDFRRAMTSELVVIDVSVGHFYLSGFARNRKTGKFAYFMTSDVRHFPMWYDTVLYRTATGPQDFTGGYNQYCSLDQLVEKLEELTNG